MLTAMYRELFPDADLQALRERCMCLPEELAEEGAEAAEPVFDPVAYQAYLAREVAAAQPVPESELAALARARAKTVRGALTSGEDAVAAEHVRLLDPASKEAGKAERVAVELGLAAD